LTYHEIELEDSPDLYRLSYSQLEEHLHFVTEFGRASQGMAPELKVTFDDGHVSNYWYIPALLEKYPCQAVFFVPAGWVGTRANAMTWGQLKELASLGYEVQSHSWSHRRLTRCSPSDLQAEVQRSRLTIEDRLGIEVSSISIPYGRWNRRVLEACARAGYKNVYTSDPWLVPTNRAGVHVWGRLTVLNTMGPNDLRRLLTLKEIPLLLQQSKYQTKELAKFLLGDRVYHWLWRHFVGLDEPAEMG
jgi:peptidoglycan/xylan/chitin deacetylase (PgdA/CDA1 family)